MNWVLTTLEPHDNPANLIPGWGGGEQVAHGHFDDDPFLDTAVVAEVGGSCRVMVFDHSGDAMLDTIVFDSSFRGGGRIAVVPATLSADRSVPSALLVVPGEGGGPVVARFDFATGQRFDFFAPYDQEFRGGLRVAVGDVDGDDRPEALFLPGAGGGPHLVAIDMRTYETELSIWVGAPDDLSGAARFEPTGGMAGGLLVVQYGLTVDHYAPTRLWTVGGEDVTERWPSL